VEQTVISMLARDFCDTFAQYGRYLIEEIWEYDFKRRSKRSVKDGIIPHLLLAHSKEIWMN
jgi:hypothetical protein